MSWKIISLQEQNNKKLIGKTIRVLFDKKEGNYFIGRTEWDSPEVDNYILTDARTNYISIGSFADIKIISAGEYDLIGEK
jgi:ribosomal protein S12 methylthiotransferase